MSSVPLREATYPDFLDVRFTDINGDGKVDFIYVNGTNGAVDEWRNEGPGAASGSSFTWSWKGRIASGNTARGSCIEFANLYGLGRSDYIGTMI